MFIILFDLQLIQGICSFRFHTVSGDKLDMLTQDVGLLKLSEHFVKKKFVYNSMDS